MRSIPVPAVAASVSYVHGVTGGNIFVMTRLGVRRLAAAMMGMDAMEVTDSEELSELDLSAARRGHEPDDGRSRRSHCHAPR